MMRHLSLTTRLTTLFAIVASIALAILGGVTMIALDKHFEAQDRDVLDGKIQLARNLVTRIDSSTSLAALPGQFRDAFVGHHDLAVTLLSPDGKTLYANEAVRFPAALLDHANAARKADFKQWQDGGRRLYGTAIAFSTRMPGTAPVIVAVAVDVNHHAVFISKFQRAMGMYVVVAALVCGLLGWLVVRQGLMPLYTMKERASSVTAGKLDLRMPIESVPVEMAELAATLNQMLGRLEDAFHRLSEFSANIAHELRTPISNLMTQTHVALSQARSNDEYRDILASNAEEFDRLARMISDMLFLARTEQGLLLPSREEIELAHEVGALFEFYEALAEEKQVALRLIGSGKIHGDRLMMRRAISNLLSNALRYTPSGQEILVSIQEERDNVILSVRNPGSGIPADALPHLFERFYRAEKDRSHLKFDNEGVGLGLSITKAIVERHGGDISARSTTEATVFSMSFPRQ
ncbi:heavy metal sensor histidine kinase [Undibacterium sp. FT79W]|uniref:heavy metal sensor histidine kinase n=1 Tax=Undibacterium sp. FT79W TaxID=2762296 RepID=UPI00164A985B|nr:heavy metal sensor histidine kinase [Undibacterium sp. FT79W]MBC3879504.1 heavy metal sensor histidine kinase [Undibacterium sp. FT79W]